MEDLLIQLPTEKPTQNSQTLTRVTSHQGIPVNEETDSYVKETANSSFIESNDPISYQDLLELIHNMKTEE